MATKNVTNNSSNLANTGSDLKKKTVRTLT